MPFKIDGSLYPDMSSPESLASLGERVDFLSRLCSAWDFGFLPDADTVAEIRQDYWRESVDVCQLLTSPSYHLLRVWHHLPVLPYLGQRLAYICNDPNLEFV
jgi:hypothetical protein